MAQITSFMLCDSIASIPVQEGGFMQQIIAPQVVLRPQFVPGNFSFAIAVGIQDIDLHHTNRIRFTVTDPQGTVIRDSGVSEFPPILENVPETMPEKYRGFLMSLDVRNLAIRENGEYAISFFVNDECIGKQSIPIFQEVTQ